jgi:hypothetical protein
MLGIVGMLAFPLLSSFPCSNSGAGLPYGLLFAEKARLEKHNKEFFFMLI